jgi:putative flavoprotein involved in K+ transport
VERVVERIARVQDGLPVLDDGRVLDVQNVIWCTGFRRDFSWIDVPFEMGEDGYPVQYRGVVASAPGLYFVGLLFLHSFTSMLIRGTGKDAERVAQHIVRERSNGRRPVSAPGPVVHRMAS